MRRRNRLGPIVSRRGLLLGTAQGAAFGALGLQLYRMQVLDHRPYGALATENSISERLIAPERGIITDRLGTVLAGNRRYWRALFIAVQARDPVKVVERFAHIIPLSEGECSRIDRDLKDKPRFVPILLKDDLDWSATARIEVHAPDLPGVFIDAGSVRFYPLAKRSAHVIGYVDRPTQREVAHDRVLALPGARVGRSGVERAHNEALQGVPGIVQTEVNVHGSVVRELDRSHSKHGATVQATLDAQLQIMAANSLGENVGAAVMLGAKGDVLLMASAPGFDPALFDNGVPAEIWSEWLDDPRRPLTNRATGGLYAPGSAFKPNVALAALDCGAITVETHFLCPGYLKLGDHVFYCWQHSGHGNVNVISALEQSCDVFFYYAALATGIDRIARMGRKLGLIGPLDIGMPNTEPGFLPTRAWSRKRRLIWTKGDTVIQGIGQGYTQVTPLGLATMTIRIATGRAVQPHLTRAVGQTLYRDFDETSWPDLGLDDRHLAAVRQGMIEAVNTPLGTAYASRLNVPGLHMAGKTGTAQVHGLTTGEEKANYNDALLPLAFRPNAFFIAFAPTDVPRYAAAIVVEHGNEGAACAAPIARDLITAALSREAEMPSAPAGTIA